MDMTSIMSRIEVPFSTGTASEIIVSETDSSSESVSEEGMSSEASLSRQPSCSRRSLHHGESCDTHMHYDAAENAPVSSPYRHEELQQILDAANKVETVNARHEANQKVMEKLANLGVSVFLISHECNDVWKEVKHCISEASSMAIYNVSADRCLLYEDEKGRLFNLLVAGDFSGLTKNYDSMLDKASGLEAICALVVLMRSFACVDLRNGINPAYIALILGLVLSEEIANAWINTSMLVRGTPSISAYTLTHPVTIDWPKQALLLILSIAAVMEPGTGRQIMTLVGIGCACAVLVANVGARAWRHLQVAPLAYRGPLRTVVAFIVATVFGLSIPYVGFRHSQPGGQMALETIIIGSFLVAVVFAISDFDKVQEFVVAGSETCNQDPVNFGVGIWWFVTVILSIFVYRCIPVRGLSLNKKEDELDKSRPIPFVPEPEPLVEEDQASPVGFRVKQIPDYKLERSGASKPYLPAKFLVCEIILGLVMAFGIGGFIIYSSFTTWDDVVTSKNYTVPGWF